MQKLQKEEMADVPHYLIDVLEPEEEFHVVRFQQMAKAAMADIYSRGKIPIIVGGTGFYIQALLYDIDFTEMKETVYIERAGGTCKGKRSRISPWTNLHGRPEISRRIHANNIKRVIRALEFYHQNGTPISEHNEEQKNR